MTHDSSEKSANPKSPNPEKAPGLLDIVLSTIAAAFGVQSKRNYHRDFKSGNLWIYIAAGVTFTIVFILAVATIVAMVLPD